MIKKVKGWACVDKETGELIEFGDKGFDIAKFDDDLVHAFEKGIEVVSVEIKYET